MSNPIKLETTPAGRVLAGKVALVTGSTSGIGLGIAHALARAGADVVLNGLGAALEIERVREQIATEFGVKARFSPADMTRPNSIAEMIAATVAQSGRLDILVNNAGIQHVVGVSHHTPGAASHASGSAAPVIDAPPSVDRNTVSAPSSSTVANRLLGCWPSSTSRMTWSREMPCALAWPSICASTSGV